MRVVHIVATSVVVAFCLLAIMALVARFFVSKHDKQNILEMTVADGSNEQQSQLTDISTTWKRLLTPKQDRSKGYWTPTLAAMIEAGDEGVLSSNIFHKLHDHPGDVSLETLYDVFAEELRMRPMAERSGYSGNIHKFLSSTKRSAGGHRRAVSISNRQARKSMDLTTIDRGLTRGLSVKKHAPVLVPMMNGLVISDIDSTQTSWMKHGSQAEHHDGHLRTQITPTELAALSLLLACPLGVSTEGDVDSTTAFGISLARPSTADQTNITLQREKRSVSHLPTRGSGYSLLFAKHLAAGSLPFSQGKTTVNSISITNDTLEAIQAGSSVYLHPSNLLTPQSEYLTSLPSSREIRFWTASPANEQPPSNPLIEAIAALPFVGGLPPLTTTPMIKSIRFIAAGGITPGRLLQRLEDLVDKVHGHSPHLNIFGPLYEPHNMASAIRERERLGRLTTRSRARVIDTLADKASRMQRYTTLLERLMALVPKRKPNEVLTAVRSALGYELDASYDNAVAARSIQSQPVSILDSHASPESNTPNKRLSTASHTTASLSPRSSVGSNQHITSPTSSSLNAMANSLSKEMEQVLKSPLPLSIEQIAFVARMVLVAWTLSVEVVPWDEAGQGFKVVDLKTLPEKMMLV